MESYALLAWLACGLVAAAIGSRKGEGCLGFVCGLLLGPLGVVVAVLSKGNRVECPYCYEQINRKARICPFCRSAVGKGKPIAIPLVSFSCPACKTSLSTEKDLAGKAVQCPRCKTKLLVPKVTGQDSS
jgi:DNA-directed RNA polymerase subunit RPC12/RpoP